MKKNTVQGDGGGEGQSGGESGIGFHHVEIRNLKNEEKIDF